MGKTKQKMQMRIIAMMQSRTTVLSSSYSVDLILTVCNTGCIKRIFRSALILHPFTGNDRNTPLKRGDSWSLHGHRSWPCMSNFIFSKVYSILLQRSITFEIRWFFLHFSTPPPQQKNVVYCRINCKQSTLVLQVLAQQTGHEGNISAQCSHTHVGVRPD